MAVSSSTGTHRTAGAMHPMARRSQTPQPATTTTTSTIAAAPTTIAADAAAASAGSREILPTRWYVKINNKLFCATTDGKLWARDPVLSDVSWQEIGFAKGVVAMAATNNKIFAATKDDKLLARSPSVS